MTSPSSSPGFDDVRMRGFRRRTPVATAIQWVEQQAHRLASERVPLADLAGRVLAEDLISSIDVPAFPRAMMDGYAVQATDTFGATAYNPLSLRVVGEVLPGQAPATSVQGGQAVRIMTGAPVPPGATAVIPAEKVIAHEESIAVQDEVAPQKHVGVVGEDIRRGDTVLPAGRCLRPQDVGVMSSLGQENAWVVRQPRVRLVITGDELCAAGSAAGTNQTVDANSPMLRALVARDGGLCHFDGILPDRPEVIRQSLLDTDADVVLVAGGSSVGQEDHAPVLLAREGTLAVHGVAMRPSSPAGMGQIGDRLVFLLPGNPVSCLCAYDFFAGRAIRLQGGRSGSLPYRKATGTLIHKLSSVVGRCDYARVQFDGRSVEPLAIGGASVLSSTSRADGFVVVPTDSEGYAAGSQVEVYCYDG